MDDLKNCPVCGAPAEAEYCENELGMGLVRCTECHMRVFGEIDSVISFWNEQAKVYSMGNRKYQEELDCLKKCEETLRALVEAKCLKNSGKTSPESEEKKERGWTQAI